MASSLAHEGCPWPSPMAVAHGG